MKLKQNLHFLVNFFFVFALFLDKKKNTKVFFSVSDFNDSSKEKLLYFSMIGFFLIQIFQKHLWREVLSLFFTLSKFTAVILSAVQSSFGFVWITLICFFLFLFFPQPFFFENKGKQLADINAFASFIKKNKTSIVFFYVTWSLKSLLYSQLFEQLVSNFKKTKVEFCKVDVGRHPYVFSTIKQFSCNSTVSPSIMFFNNDQLMMFPNVEVSDWTLFYNVLVEKFQLNSVELRSKIGKYNKKEE